MANPNPSPKTRFKSGPSNPYGNNGGSRHKVAKAVENLFAGEGEALSRKCIELALEGDMAALKLCIDRICPMRRDAPIKMKLPPAAKLADLPTLQAEVLKQLAAGELTPSEADAVARLVETQRKALESRDLEQRVAALEQSRRG